MKRLTEWFRNLFRPRVSADDAMMDCVAGLCFQTGKTVYGTVDDEGRLYIEIEGDDRADSSQSDGCGDAAGTLGRGAVS